MLSGDDRIETPEGVEPRVRDSRHPIVKGLPDRWPALLGYNRLVAKPESSTIAVVGTDPLLVAWSFGEGRSVAFTSDCGPHWAPPSFVEWEGYATLWRQIVTWVTGEATA